jgi:hypothetical protein
VVVLQVEEHEEDHYYFLVLLKLNLMLSENEKQVEEGPQA